MINARTDVFFELTLIRWMVAHKAKHVWAFDSVYTPDVRYAVPVIIFWSLMFVDVALYVRKRVQNLIVQSGCEMAAVSHRESVKFLTDNGYEEVHRDRFFFNDMMMMMMLKHTHTKNTHTHILSAHTH